MGPTLPMDLTFSKLLARAIRYSGFFGVRVTSGSDRWRFLRIYPLVNCKYHQNGGFSMAMLVYRRVPWERSQ